MHDTLPLKPHRQFQSANLSAFGRRILIFAGLMVSHQCWAAPCGSTDAWSLVVDSGVNSIYTDTIAAMAGSQCGLVVAPNNDTVKRYVQDESPATVGPDGAKNYRLSFYFDPNSISLPPGTLARVAVIKTLNLSSPFKNLVLMNVRKDSTSYILNAWARSGTNKNDKSLVELPLIDGPNVIEVQLTIGDGTGNGIFRLWVNNNTEGSPDYEDLSLNNAAYKGVDLVRLGLMTSSQPIQGQIYFDEVVSRTNRFIGTQR